MILYQDCSSHLDSSKNMAARWRGLFSLYIYIENFKNLLVRNHWTDFNIILQKCSFGDPLLRLFKPLIWIHQNTWPPGGGAYFPYVSVSEKTLKIFLAARGRSLFSLYIYIENFKNLFVRNHWTDFNIILQKCFFCDPLPRLFKPPWFVKKHGR